MWNRLELNVFTCLLGFNLFVRRLDVTHITALKVTLVGESESVSAPSINAVRKRRGSKEALVRWTT